MLIMNGLIERSLPQTSVLSQTLHRIESNKIYQKSALVDKPNVYINQENGKFYIELKLLKFDTPTVNGRIYPRENSIEIAMSDSEMDLPGYLLADQNGADGDTELFFKDLNTSIEGDYLVATAEISELFFEALSASDQYYYPNPFIEGCVDRNIVFHATLYGFKLIRVDYLNFGEAMELIKEGKKVTRLGWNGGDMNLQAQFPNEHSKMTFPYLYLTTPERTQSNVTEGERRFPWQPAQVDVFSNDWMEV